MSSRGEQVAGTVAHEAAVVQDAVKDHIENQRKRIRAVSKTRKSAATRERIMAAAIHLMSEHGSTDFQMSEVSTLCHMSKGSLYYYFSDRDELVDAVFDSTVDDLVTSMETIVEESESARAALSGIGAEFSRRMRPGSPLALAMSRELARGDVDVLSAAQTHLSRAVRVIAEQLERAKSEGVVRDEIDARVSATFLTGGFLVASASSVISGHPADHDELGAQLVELALRGIGCS